MYVPVLALLFVRSFMTTKGCFPILLIALSMLATGCASRTYTGTVRGATGKSLACVPLEVRRPITKWDTFPGPWVRGGMRVESATQSDTNGHFAVNISRKATELWVYAGGTSNPPVRVPIQSVSQHRNIEIPSHALRGTCVPTAASLERIDSLNPVPMSVIRDIPDRLARLQTGEAPPVIFAALGLSDFRTQLSSESGGPIDAHWSLYQLRHGFNLLLVFEHRSVGHPRFEDGRLSGNGWDSLKHAPELNSQMQEMGHHARDSDL
jgi:hypothetical protein